MKLSKNHIQTSIFILIYLFAIYFWSQPLQERKLPYGEFDAMSHFEVGDYIAFNDKSIFYLPPYIDLRYGGENRLFPHTLWYPPTFHSAFAVGEIIGRDRVISIFLLNTIMSTFIIITVYFVINSLFGFLPAILSSLLIIFSPRDFMPYLWGQWPERFAYAFVPIILYCFYKYFISFSKEYNNPRYIYLTALFLGVSLLIHPLIFFHSALGLAVLYIFLAIKQKKFVFNFKHILVSALIFLVLFMSFPYQTLNILPNLGIKTFGVKKEISNEQIQKPIFARLLQWSLDPEPYAGSVPASYFSFREMHGLWTLPFLLLGILFLVLRREEKDLFLLAWLVSLYLVLHRDLIGLAPHLHRSLSATEHIFAPLAAIGAVYLGSFIKLPSNYNKYLKYAIAVVFVYFAVSVNMAYSSQFLNKDTYNPNTRNGFFTTLNNEEFKAGQWILENVPSDYNVTVLGIPSTENILDATSRKIRWLAAVSQHVNRFFYLRTDQQDILKSKDWYILLDYTMLGPLNDKETFNKMQELEKTALANHTLVYSQDNIRVYKLETKK